MRPSCGIPEPTVSAFSTRRAASSRAPPGVDCKGASEPGNGLPWLNAEKRHAEFILRAQRRAPATDVRLSRGHPSAHRPPCTLTTLPMPLYRRPVSVSPTKRPRLAGRLGSEMIQQTTRMIGARHFGSSCARERGVGMMIMDSPSSCSAARCVADIRSTLLSTGWIRNARSSASTSPSDRLQHRILAFRESRLPRRTIGITSCGLGMAYLRKPGVGSSSHHQQATFSSSAAPQHGSHDHSVPTGATSSARSAAVPDARITNDISGDSKASSKQVHEHAHDHDHDHSHAHSLFHSHAHDHSASAGELVSALSRNDRGSRITLLGLASNVLLTALKGVAGYAMNSASLIAEAGHSFSDLGADFVTLACWKVSRRDPTRAYPYGYGKFETIGTLSVSLILVVAGIGIALHSYHVSLDPKRGTGDLIFSSVAAATSHDSVDTYSGPVKPIAITPAIHPIVNTIALARAVP